MIRVPQKVSSQLYRIHHRIEGSFQQIGHRSDSRQHVNSTSSAIHCQDLDFEDLLKLAVDVEIESAGFVEDLLDGPVNIDSAPSGNRPVSREEQRQPTKRQVTQRPEHQLSVPTAASGSHGRRYRGRKRRALTGDQTPNARTIERYVKSVVPIETTLQIESLPVAHGAYTGMHQNIPNRCHPYSLAEAKQLGFKVIAWDG
jgi:hypothetical protein